MSQSSVRERRRDTDPNCTIAVVSRNDDASSSCLLVVGSLVQGAKQWLDYLRRCCARKSGDYSRGNGQVRRAGC